MLEINSITKHYAAPVLAGVSFQLNPGEIVAILGASGCGKTTLLRILAGLDAASSGTVESPLVRPGPAVGYMPQQAPLAPWLTVKKNVLLPVCLADKKEPRHTALADDVLRQMQLADCAESYPAALSGGMQQRVALAALLVLQPHLYLLDEPLGQLDLPLRRRVADILRADVIGRKASAVLVTHSIEEALFIADRILVLGGQPASIVAHYSVKTPAPGHVLLDTATAYHTVLGALEAAERRAA